MFVVKPRHKAPPNPKHVSDDVAARWTGPVVSEGFVPVPLSLLRAYGDEHFGPTGGGLSTSELVAILLLAMHKRDADHPFPRVHTLATMMRITNRAMSGILKSLRDKGLIEVSRSKETGYRQFEMTGLFRAIEQWMAQNPRKPTRGAKAAA